MSGPDGLPTTHERMSGKPWDASYGDGPAPWDIGEPQPAVARLVLQHTFVAPVLDAGCGTGENALCIASEGSSVLGVDVAKTALAMAREKAEQRGIEAEFALADALHLERLNRRFRTVLDCGLFHSFDADERVRYVSSLASVVDPGGTLHLLCFSDRGSDLGPHPIGLEALRAPFDATGGWSVVSVEPERLQTRFHDQDGAPAWLARVDRKG